MDKSTSVADKNAIISIIAWAFLSVVLISIYHFFTNRAPQIWMATAKAAPIFVIIFIGMGIRLFRDPSFAEERKTRPARFLRVIVTIIATFGIGFTISFTFFMAAAFDLLVMLVQKPLALAAIVPGIVAIVLFGFRLKYRAIYGLSEMAVGYFIAIYKIGKEGRVDLDVTLAVLTAGVYLMVRGFDNIHQGWDADPIVIRIRRLSNREIDSKQSIK